MPHTPGPWTWKSTMDENNLVDGKGEYVLRALGAYGYEAAIDVTDADERLIAQAPAMYELLKEVEWQGTLNGQLAHGACPFCNGWGVHYEFCRLAAVLKAVEG